MRLEVPEQKIAIRAQPEEPVVLLHPLERARGMQHALSVDDLVVLLERLAADAVVPRVRLLVEVIRGSRRSCSISACTPSLCAGAVVRMN